ncbi:hypothetical protein [Ensifer sp. SL37]|uniref:hypothetical protein n=1 Tax=Ensifer sp. SL37 TaxID=2995137 RepID=UPI002276D344|nr:hypothetical protein [Ensifer sp. SL37]MCY1741457.1 hypothetical protein [Ensifer sp. SL37]
MEFANESIFENLFEAAKVSPAVKSLDPLADLMAKPVTRISYKRKIKRNSTSAFMEFTKKDRNWLDLLLRELTTIHKAFQADASIMLSASSAKRGTGRTQTWEDFVVELYDDKVAGRNDFSEGQLRHLPNLIAELSKGRRLSGCGSIEFTDIDSGVQL